MPSKLLILSIYPAPYRFELIQELIKNYEADVFFESSDGDERNLAWFSHGDYHLLDNDEGLAIYHQSVKKIRQYSAVILYDYATKESAFLILRCRILRIPFILNADGVKLTKHGNVFRELLKKLIISGASGCFASGINAKNYFLRYGIDEKKIYLHSFSTLHPSDIIDAPINSDEKKQLRKKLGIPESFSRVAIAVGRFIELKRFDVLIQLWTRMPKDWCLLLVGGGTEEEKYKSIINNNSLNNVIIEGFHSKEELKEYYCAADVLVHPTRYDVWGLIINEAMACGLPVVVSDHCIAGLELVEQGKNGFVVKLYDDKALADGIVSILHDDELRAEMSVASISRIRPYTIENMAECQLKALKEILSSDEDNSKRR